jgi:hypothetical protein
MTNTELLVENIKRGKTDLDDMYNKGYSDGKAEGGTPDPKLVRDAELLYLSNRIDFSTTNITELEMDCINKTSFQYFVQNCEQLVTVKVKNTQKVSNWYFAFAGCNNLLTLEELDFSSLSTTSNAFRCANVTRFRIVAGTIKSSVDFSYMGKLDDESLWSVVNGYADMTGQTSPVLTLHADVKARIVADDAKEDTDPSKCFWLKTLTDKNVTLA